MKKLWIIIAVACVTMFVACTNVEQKGKEFGEAMALAMLEGKDEKADSLEVESLKYMETLSEKDAEKFCAALEKTIDEIMNL